MFITLPGVRNPMNLLTAFVDAGNLYSNSDTDLNELRAMVTGDIAQHTSRKCAWWRFTINSLSTAIQTQISNNRCRIYHFRIFIFII